MWRVASQGWVEICADCLTGGGRRVDAIVAAEGLGVAIFVRWWEAGRRDRAPAWGRTQAIAAIIETAIFARATVTRNPKDMSTVPTKESPDAALAETVGQRFRRLESVWTADVCYSSSPSEHWEHPAFREIIRMGEAVVPLMMRDLEKEPQLWVWALLEITGANPVQASEAGNIKKMSEAWVRWGREHGYQW